MKIDLHPYNGKLGFMPTSSSGSDSGTATRTGFISLLMLRGLAWPQKQEQIHCRTWA